ncbi:G-protein coupled receptors family 3 profile domain-containing protein [Caenorhabditis elegans]|uniref:G-protein coupled receptors family 3 profile domain-containing protein n=3 Tax=Caenorhabditis elegans TaxID=6239 RepID=Q8MXU2_CAEEL|nr:G-protein coupled receptors family 3 profile domain-containing protein [Caenorhabditis elegans]CCD74029.2 G-protein coupled receptors family 3 profile domain-containing protein [Caenorhabditis elegans]|eukprot:NP_741400.2 Metabotropic GLutamate receptor family [Caenorhabditis elegans]
MTCVSFHTPPLLRRYSSILQNLFFFFLLHIPISSTVKQLTVPGQIVLGGLFPIHEAGRNASHQCGKIKADQGVQRMVAMLFALEKVNRDRQLLPQASLGAQILDTCSVDSYALEQTLEFIKSVMSNGDGVTCADGSTGSYTRQPVVAVVGAAGSQVSVMVASMLQLFKIPQVSYSSTGAELSEKPRFAFFSRVVPPDNLQAQVMARVIGALEWTYVHAIADTGSYGERGMDSFRAAAAENGICIDGDVQKISRRWTEKNFRDLLIRMHRTRKARGVVMFVDEDNLKRLLKTLDLLVAEGHTELDRHFWFVASDSWGIKQSVVRGLEHRTYGAITIAPMVREETGYLEYFRSLSPKGFVFLEEFFEYLGCSATVDVKTFGDCFDMVNITLKQESYVPFVVDTVKIIAKAISMYIEDDCGKIPFHKCTLAQSGFRGERLQRYYRNMSLIKNEPALIDANGDGIGRYDVFQLDINGVYQKVGKWRSTDDFLSVEVEKIRHAFKTAHGERPMSVCSTDCPRGHYRAYQDQTCCWACIPCDTSTSIHNETSCEECAVGMVPDRTLHFCVPIPPVSMQWDTTWSLIPAAFSTLGIASTIFVVSVFLKFSNTPVIMASGRELCYCMMSGIGMCYTLTFFLVSQPTVITCSMTRILMGLSMSAIYAAIITKTNRLARVFKPDSAQRPRFITPKAQVGICMGIVSVQLIGTFVWILFDPPGTMIVFPTRTEAVLTCKATTSHLLISLLYNILLIVACTVYAFKTRKIPENFNETRHIGFTMYSTCILWLAFGPIYFATQSDFRIQITSLCMCISLSGTVALICFFAPKVYIVLFQPYKNVRTRQSAVGRLVNQQMRFMSQLTYNPDGCNSYQPMSSNQSYKPSTEESSHTSNAQVQQPTRAIPPHVIEQLAASLPISDKNDLVKKLSLQDKFFNNNNNNENSEEIRRRRPSSVHTVGAVTNGSSVAHIPPRSYTDEPKSSMIRQDTAKSRTSLAESHQVDLILEEIAADTNSTFL